MLHEMLARDNLARSEPAKTKPVPQADQSGVETRAEAISVRRTSVRRFRPTGLPKTVESSPRKPQPRSGRHEGKGSQQYHRTESKASVFRDMHRVKLIPPKSMEKDEPGTIRISPQHMKSGNTSSLSKEQEFKGVPEIPNESIGLGGPLNCTGSTKRDRESAEQSGKEISEKNKGLPVTTSNAHVASSSEAKCNDGTKTSNAQGKEAQQSNEKLFSTHLPCTDDTQVFPAEDDQISPLGHRLNSTFTCAAGDVNVSKSSLFQSFHKSMKQKSEGVCCLQSSHGNLQQSTENTKDPVPGTEPGALEDETRPKNITRSIPNTMHSPLSIDHEVFAFAQSGHSPSLINSGRSAVVQVGPDAGTSPRKPSSGGQDFILRNIRSVKRKPTLQTVIGQAQTAGHGDIDRALRSKKSPAEKHKQKTVNKPSIHKVKSLHRGKKSPRTTERAHTNIEVNTRASKHEQQRNEESPPRATSYNPGGSERSTLNTETNSLQLSPPNRYVQHSQDGAQTLLDHLEQHWPAFMENEFNTPPRKRFKKKMSKTRTDVSDRICKIPVLKTKSKNSPRLKLLQGNNKSKSPRLSPKEMPGIPKMLKEKIIHSKSRSVPVTGLPFMITVPNLQQFNTDRHAPITSLIHAQTYFNECPLSVSKNNRFEHQPYNMCQENISKVKINSKGNLCVDVGNRCDENIIVSNESTHQTRDTAYCASRLFAGESRFSTELDIKEQDPHSNLKMKLKDSAVQSETDTYPWPHIGGTNSPIQGTSPIHTQLHSHNSRADALNILSYESSGQGTSNRCQGSFLGEIIREITEHIPLAVQQNGMDNFCSLSQRYRQGTNNDYVRRHTMHPASVHAEDQKLMSNRNEEHTPKARTCGMLGLHFGDSGCRKLRIKLSVTSTSNETGFVEMEKKEGVVRESCQLATPNKDTKCADIYRQSRHDMPKVVQGKKQLNTALLHEGSAENPLSVSSLSFCPNVPTSCEGKSTISEFVCEGTRPSAKHASRVSRRNKISANTYIRNGSPPIKSRRMAKKRRKCLSNSPIAESEFESCIDEKWYARRKKSLKGMGDMAVGNVDKSCAQKILRRKIPTRHPTSNFGNLFKIRFSWGTFFIAITLPLTLFFLSLHYVQRAKVQGQDSSILKQSSL